MRARKSRRSYKLQRSSRVSRPLWSRFALYHLKRRGKADYTPGQRHVFECEVVPEPAPQTCRCSIGSLPHVGVRRSKILSCGS